MASGPSGPSKLVSDDLDWLEKKQSEASRHKLENPSPTLIRVLQNNGFDVSPEGYLPPTPKLFYKLWDPKARGKMTGIGYLLSTKETSSESENEDLCKRAKKLESEESKKINFDCPFVSVLEVLLLDVYRNLRPRPSEYEQRRQLVHVFNKMIDDIFGSSNGFPTIEAFGSFVMDIFTTGSDLDLSLNFSNDYTTEFPRDKKISMLRKFSRSLYALQARGLVSGIQPIMRARVPVLKVIDCGTGVECDISVENKDGITRSSILTIVASLDERFRILSYLMKIWAKAHDINSSKDHTMNSLTIISLIALHLQTRDPSILPPFSTLFKDGTDSSSIQNAFLRYRASSGRNDETVSKLFLSLFNKLSSVGSLWRHGLCASTYDGSWISKTWESGNADMSVEDFLDRSQNLARSVSKGGLQKISTCIRNSVSHISLFMKGQIEAPKLKTLLFGSIPLNIPSDQYIPREQMGLKRRLELPALVDSVTTKKARYAPYETPANNPFPTPDVPLRPSFVPLRPSYQLPHLDPSSVPSQSRYGLDQQPPVAPHTGYGPQRPQFPYSPRRCYDQRPPGAPHSGYDPQQPQFPLAPHRGYGSAHDRRPAFPFAHPGYGEHDRDRRPAFPLAHPVYGSAHDRPEFPFAPPSGYGSAHDRPEFPFAPPSGYGPVHDRQLAIPSQFHYGWQHN